MTLQEVEKSVNEIWALFRETDKRFQETERFLSQKFQETDRFLSQKFQETDRLLSQKFQETDKKFRKTDNEIERVSKNIDNLGGKWGKFVEGLVAPGVIRMFNERGIEIESTSQRVKVSRGSDKMEIDILGVNTEYVMLIEVKSTLGVDDVNDHLDRMSKFKRVMPEYADRKVIGAVAGIIIEEGVDKFAYRKGFFVIVQSGESVQILNDNKFKPKVW
ncbi:DUF3782 domain-containing protein [Candidatus Magnetomoraceae bacterium gMMP-15]